MSGMSVREWWSTRALRERTLLMAGGAALLILLTYWLVVEPLVAAGGRAARALPELRAQSAELNELAGQARRLKGQAGVASVAPASVASLTASAAGAGLAPRITAQGEGGFAVTAEGASLGALQTWLVQVQSGHRLHVRSARLLVAGEGRIDAQLVLAQ